MELKQGRYKGRAIDGSQQYGVATNDRATLQIAIDITIPELQTSATCFLYFSSDSAPYSIQRLRALGWEGEDIRDLKGIDKNEVDVELRQETYEGKARWKLEIMTGPGRVTLEKPLNKDEWAARFKAIQAAMPAGGSAPVTSSSKPPWEK